MTSGLLATGASAALLAGLLAFAALRPRDLPEAVFAVPAAVVVVATGMLPLGAAEDEMRRVAPAVAFLAAILMLSRLCDVLGLFRAAGRAMAVGGGDPRRLLTRVVVAAAVVTAVLSLDATVVLLTPVVFATATRLGVRARPHAYACTHIANAGSLLLPVSNLTNLLAVAASGITFVRFGLLMALPWLAVIAVELVALRVRFATDLSVGTRRPAPPDDAPVPVFAVAVLALTLAGFVVASLVHVEPAWVAAAGVALLAWQAVRDGRTTPAAIARDADVPFLLFVPALAIVVAALVHHGLGDAIGRIAPQGHGLVALALWCLLATLLANTLNNLPAMLVLLPVAAPAGVGALLATVIGVNVGPNLTYTGSLATLLWRRVLREHDHDAPLAEFTGVGALATPAALVAAIVALWAGLQVFGGGA